MLCRAGTTGRHSLWVSIHIAKRSEKLEPPESSMKPKEMEAAATGRHWGRTWGSVWGLAGRWPPRTGTGGAALRPSSPPRTRPERWACGGVWSDQTGAALTGLQRGLLESSQFGTGTMKPDPEGLPSPHRHHAVQGRVHVGCSPGSRAQHLVSAESGSALSRAPRSLWPLPGKRCSSIATVRGVTLSGTVPKCIVELGPSDLSKLQSFFCFSLERFPAERCGK